MEGQPVDRTALWQLVSGGVAFLAVTASTLIAVFGGGGVGTTAGEVAIFVLALVFAAAVAVVAILALRYGEPGGTLSEITREAAREVILFPWALGVFAGRWFHPVDDFKLLGIAGPIILMGLTFVIVVVAALLQRAGKEFPSWVAAGAGVLAGALLWSERFA